jgi:hypothetical protein
MVLNSVTVLHLSFVGTDYICSTYTDFDKEMAVGVHIFIHNVTRFC